jgi:hypothetical protein
MRRRLPLTVLAALAVLLVAATASFAHTAQVLPRGSQTVDLGTDPGSQLIHAVLEAPGDTLTVRLVVPTAGTFAIDVLVPDQPQERRVHPVVTLRSAGQSRGAKAATTDPLAAPKAKLGSRLSDRGTGIRYRRIIGNLTAADGLEPGRAVELTIQRGSVPLRVAVRTDDGSKFQLDNAKEVPRTVTRLGGWFTSPAAGAPHAGSDSLADGFRALVWIPLSIAGIMVLTAVWWMVRGRRASRVRGAERAEIEAGERRGPG